LKNRHVILAVAAVAIGLVVIGGLINRLSAKTEGNRHFTFTYQFKVQGIPEDASDVQLFVPLPPSDEHQTVGKVNIRSPYAYKKITDSQYDDHILEVDVPDNAPKDIDMTVSFDVERQENRALDMKGKFTPETQENLERYLRPDSLVPINGKIAAEAKSVINSKMTDMEKIEALYEHLFETMKYDKTGTGWGHGDALFACDARRQLY